MLSASKSLVGVVSKKFKLSIRFASSPAAVSGPSEVGQENAKPSKLHESKSFCMNLFRGHAHLEQVFPYPLKLDEDRRETLDMIYAPMEKFMEEVNDPFQNDADATISKEVIKSFAEMGGLGMGVPEHYEGAGLNNTQAAKISELIGGNDLAFSIVVGAHQSIGYKGILLFGSEAQKQKYLPDLATGRKMAAFCLTEAGSGSDASSIRTRAEKSQCGKFYVINGGKIWISNGGFADVFTVFAQTPCKRKDGSIKDKISAFVVERSFGGVTSGPPEKKMGIKGSNTAEVYFDNVKVPVENLIGEEGEGFKVAMNILNNGRFGLPAGCTGSMKYCIKKSIDHVNSRVQFGKKLCEFGNVHEKIADMVVRHYVTESIVYMLASNMDAGVPEFQLEAAVAKVVASENAWHVCDEAIQLHGGMGFMRDCGLERVLRDLRIFRIFEGANDVMRLFIALTGMQYSGKHLQQLFKDIKSGRVTALFGEIKRRAFGDIGGDICSAVDPSLKESAASVNSVIKEFGIVVQSLLRHYGRRITDRQYELTRVANAVIDIYSMVAVLSRASYAMSKKGKESVLHDQQISRLFVEQASKRALVNLKEASGSNSKEIDLIGQIAVAVCDKQAMIQKHPIDI